jgi:hypothetical protein
MIRRRIEPMVKGLVQDDWQEVALREIIARTFTLNYQGTKAAIDAEMTTCFMGSAWRILWALFGDHGLKPEDVEVGCDGLAGDFAHVRWSAYETNDPYSDVVVHEAAHMLHYLKPSHYGLHVRRGQERFVDTEFRHRELFAYSCEAYSRVVLHGERKSRIALADKMNAGGLLLSTRPDRRSGRAGSRGCSRSEWLAGNPRGDGDPQSPKASEGRKLTRVEKGTSCFKKNNPRQPPYST